VVDGPDPVKLTGSRRTVLLEVTLMRIVVDFNLCESNALCVDAAPEVFEVRDDDFLYVLNENPGEELRAKVEAAVRVCPKQAIKIED
jgi:ferredoxin